MDTVVIYPGRFHPFHKGHKSVYDTLVKRFGKDRVYIATSNKVDPPKSPFTFDEKRAMMALTGVDPSRVVQTKNPYQATEITDNFDPQNTTALFAISDKDMAEDPRFSFKPKKDGSPSYYQPAQKDMRPMSEHGYIITVPTLQFNVLGKPMRSASEFRANFAVADSETQKAMITDLFGRYDPKTHSTMSQKINEQLVRADAILDQLIELGADDCYILEACIRVDTLVESINMKQRKKSLYQAIMEGGHSLPVLEAELACPVAAGDLAVNTENRDRTIKQFNYGPLNVDVPGDYWKDIGEYWNTTEEAAKASNCGNCVAFDISERMKDCLPGDTFDDDGELGYCWMHHFKCHSARSCHTWAKGGPIKNEKESAEWQGKAFGGQGVKEEITDFNKEDPMNSVIAIRGIGTMSISSALKEISEMSANVSNLAKVKHAKGIQDNFDRYMSLLNVYNDGIQEAYSELAQQRKRGGTASRGIDKDISEVMEDVDYVKPQFDVEWEEANRYSYFDKLGQAGWEQLASKGKVITLTTDSVKQIGNTGADGSESLDDLEPDKVARLQKAMDSGTVEMPIVVKQPDGSLDLVAGNTRLIGLISTQGVAKVWLVDASGLSESVYEDQDISEVMDQDRLNKFLGKKHDDDEDYKDDLMPITIGGGRKKKGSRPPLDFDPFGDLDEHCGDPMADDHKPMRMLLMKLYDKEMQCKPGSPEHFEVMQMIDGCRKNIGLSENVFTDVINKVKGDFKRRKKLFGKGKSA